MNDAELQATVAAMRARAERRRYYRASFVTLEATEALALCDAVERLTQERDAARESLGWALDEIADGVDGIPPHTCDFFTNPEKGACDYHENYWKARAQLDAPAPPHGEEGAA